MGFGHDLWFLISTPKLSDDERAQREMVIFKGRWLATNDGRVVYEMVHECMVRPRSLFIR